MTAATASCHCHVSTEVVTTNFFFQGAETFELRKTKKIDTEHREKSKKKQQKKFHRHKTNSGRRLEESEQQQPQQQQPQQLQQQRLTETSFTYCIRTLLAYPVVQSTSCLLIQAQIF